MLLRDALPTGKFIRFELRVGQEGVCRGKLDVNPEGELEDVVKGTVVRGGKYGVWEGGGK